MTTIPCDNDPSMLGHLRSRTRGLPAEHGDKEAGRRGSRSHNRRFPSAQHLRHNDSSRIIAFFECLVILWGVGGMFVHYCMYNGIHVYRRELFVRAGEQLMSVIHGQSSAAAVGASISGNVLDDTTAGAAALAAATGASQKDSPTPRLLPTQTCAMNFFGLPRSFETLVLPSIVENVLRPNAKYNCDVYFHYFDVDFEPKGRFSAGGRIDTSAVYRLNDEVQKIYRSTFHPSYSGVLSFLDDADIPSPPVVHFVRDTNETFWKAREQQLDTYLNTKDERGKYKYFPYHAHTWTYPDTLINVVKQWHSIERVWQDMDDKRLKMGKKYERVAMFRNDVVYISTIDVFNDGPDQSDDEDSNEKVKGVLTIPSFASYPVNDRMIYGPYQGVKTWALERFAMAEKYANHPPDSERGWILHAERYLSQVVFQKILKSGYAIDQDPSICFFRARADGSVLLSDCDERHKHLQKREIYMRKIAVEETTGTKCKDATKDDDVYSARCVKRRLRKPQ